MPRYQAEFLEPYPKQSDCFPVRFSFSAPNTKEAWAIFRTFQNFFIQNKAFLEIQGPNLRGEQEDFQYTEIHFKPHIEFRCPHCGWIDFLPIDDAGKEWECTHGCRLNSTICDDCETCKYRIQCLPRGEYER